MGSKADIRKHVKALKKELSTDTKTQSAKLVFEKLNALDSWKLAKNVLLYNSLPDELDTHSLIENAIINGKKNIYLPRVNGDDLDIVRVENLGELTSGAFNIYEPNGNNIITPDMLDLIIIPGVAFDRFGNRLGRGKGFYDRLLACTNAKKIGICYDCQLLEGIPTEAHDKKMDAIITPSEILVF